MLDPALTDANLTHFREATHWICDFTTFGNVANLKPVERTTRPKVRFKPRASESLNRKLIDSPLQWLSLNKMTFSVDVEPSTPFVAFSAVANRSALSSVTAFPKFVSQLKHRTAACLTTVARLESGKQKIVAVKFRRSGVPTRHSPSRRILKLCVLSRVDSD